VLFLHFILGERTFGETTFGEPTFGETPVNPTSGPTWGPLENQTTMRGYKEA
jgi:hypothetical protein